MSTDLIHSNSLVDLAQQIKKAVPTVPKALEALIAMERELGTAKTYEEIRQIIREANAFKVLLGHVAEVKVQAEDTILTAHRRIGEEIKKIPKAPGGGQRGKNGFTPQGNSTGRSAVGIPGTSRARLVKLADIPNAQIKATAEALRAEGKDATVKAVVTAITQGDQKERRAARERELGNKIAAGNLDLPRRKFGLILADPAWGRTVYSQATGMDRHAGNHYPTPKGDEATQDDSIKALPVASIAAKDCVLGLWCTDPPRGVDVMRAWGFEPKSYCVWIKDIIPIEGDAPPIEGDALSTFKTGDRFEVVGAAGTGFWFRDRDEILLIGVRGKPVCPALGTQGESVWFARRGEHASQRDEIHSDKPECSFLWFERHWPNTPKAELNRRGPPRPGWVPWGFEAEPAEDEAPGSASGDPP